MSNDLQKLGLVNVGHFESFNAFPRQAIIAGRRGNAHTITAGEAGNYIYTGLTTGNVAEGRQFLDIANTQGYSVIPFLEELNLWNAKRNVMIINASALINCTGTTRRFAQIVMRNANTLEVDYQLHLMAGAPDASNRLMLAATTVITPSAFDHNTWPCLQFNLQEGDEISWWGITAILQ